jgi:hypothetical protein
MGRETSLADFSQRPTGLSPPASAQRTIYALGRGTVLSSRRPPPRLSRLAKGDRRPLRLRACPFRACVRDRRGGLGPHGPISRHVVAPVAPPPWKAPNAAAPDQPIPVDYRRRSSEWPGSYFDDGRHIHWPSRSHGHSDSRGAFALDGHCDDRTRPSPAYRGLLGNDDSGMVGLLDIPADAHTLRFSASGGSGFFARRRGWPYRTTPTLEVTEMNRG